MNKDKFILDTCCGGRMMWLNKKHPNALYIDNRKEEFLIRQGHMKEIIINPDIVMDFRKLEFPDKSFKLVVCDPPHLTKLGETGLYKKMFGKLGINWKDDLKQGFKEMWRVLDDYGILIVKWNDYEIKVKELKLLFPVEPLFANVKNGAGKSGTYWFCFMKIPDKIKRIGVRKMKEALDKKILLVKNEFFREGIIDDKIVLVKDVRQKIKNILERIEDFNDSLRKDNLIWRLGADELNDLWEEKVKEIIKEEVGEGLI